MTDNTTTTVKIRSALLSQPDEVQQAQNAFAVAVKRFREDPTPENQAVMDTAQKALYRVQDAYRDGRQKRLEFARGKLQQQTGRRA